MAMEPVEVEFLLVDQPPCGEHIWRIVEEQGVNVNAQGRTWEMNLPVDCHWSVSSPQGLRNIHEGGIPCQLLGDVPHAHEVVTAACVED